MAGYAWHCNSNKEIDDTAVQFNLTETIEGNQKTPDDICEKLTESRSTENQIWQIQIPTTQVRTWCQRISYIYWQQQPNSQKAQM